MMEKPFANPVEVLKSQSEEMPQWLRRFRRGNALDHRAFFDSRTVYYPGFGDDGHPLEVFGKAHAAHCFVFADYGNPAAHYWEQLTNPHHSGHPKGYEPLSVQRIQQSDLGVVNWVPHHTGPGPDSIAAGFIRDMGEPFGIFAVLQRMSEFGPDHGPERLALIILGADGFAAYDGLYCQGGPPPYAVLLQEHGFGGNWDRFGDGGILCELAQRFNRPEWILVADNTRPWPGYTRVSDSSRGGMHRHERFLWKNQL